MALGKPVIGRVVTKSQANFFSGSGLLRVDDVESLVNHLSCCESEVYRNEVGEISREFVPANASLESEFMKWNIV